MSNEPDPQTVHEIAQTAGLLIVESVARDHIVHKAMAQHGVSHDNVYAWSEIYDRVLDEIGAALKPLTQPDEQQQDERDGDVRAVAAELRQEFGVQAEHSTSAFRTRTEEDARSLAATYSRVREPGCKPTPHYAVTRFSSDWQRLPDEPTAELDAREAKASATDRGEGQSAR